MLLLFRCIFLNFVLNTLLFTIYEFMYNIERKSIGLRILPITIAYVTMNFSTTTFITLSIHLDPINGSHYSDTSLTHLPSHLLLFILTCPSCHSIFGTATDSNHALLFILTCPSCHSIFGTATDSNHAR